MDEQTTTTPAPETGGSKNLGVIAGIALVIIILGFAWSTKKKEASPVITGPIKIGLSAPMTGEAASWGQYGAAAAQLAVDEINNAGGIGGQKIELVIEDDKCDKDGVNAWQKLVNVDQVTAIAGPVCSSVGGPALPIAQSAGMPVVITGASAPHLAKIGDFIFRIYPSDAFQGPYAAEFIFSKLNKKKIAVVYVKNDWGQGVKEAFVPKFKELGGQIAVEEGVTQEERDFRGIATKIKAAKVEAVFMPLYPGGGIPAIKQLKEIGIKVPIIGGDAFVAGEIISSEVAEGVIFTVPVIDQPEAFKEKVKALTKTEPNIAGPLSYDAIKILAEVIGKVGTDKTKIKEALQLVRYNGVSTPVIEFDQDGDLKEARYEVKVIKDKKDQPYQP